MTEQATRGSEPGPSGAKMGAGAITSLIGVALLLTFMAQNRDSVPITFLFWRITWPLWLVILVSAAAGGVIWIGLGVMHRHRRRKERRASR